MQAVPTGSLGVLSSGTAGECHSLASMDTHLQRRQGGRHAVAAGCHPLPLLTCGPCYSHKQTG